MLLPLLWQMHPYHPNLVPAYIEDPLLIGLPYETISKQNWVAKHLFGREGEGIFFSQDYNSYLEFIKAIYKDKKGNEIKYIL